jgi:hypothetical protein
MFWQKPQMAHPRPVPRKNGTSKACAKEKWHIQGLCQGKMAHQKNSVKLSWVILNSAT